MTEPCGQCGHPIADEETVTVNQRSGGPSYRVHRRCAALLPVAEAPPQDDPIAPIKERLLKHTRGEELAWSPAYSKWRMLKDIAVALAEIERVRAASCAPRTPAEPEIEAWALMLPDGVHDLEAKSLTTGRLLSDADSYQWVKLVDVKALPSADRWQPIETAPKNGLPIVLGFWNNPSKLGFWSQLKMEWLRLGAPSPTTLEPTHWMSLPPSPAEKAPTR